MGYEYRFLRFWHAKYGIHYKFHTSIRGFYFRRAKRGGPAETSRGVNWSVSVAGITVFSD
jgi:hypothetical protein